MAVEISNRDGRVLLAWGCLLLHVAWFGSFVPEELARALALCDEQKNLGHLVEVTVP